jgi:hypothetical protein
VFLTGLFLVIIGTVVYEMYKPLDKKSNRRGEEGWSQDTKVGRNIALNPKNG